MDKSAWMRSAALPLLGLLLVAAAPLTPAPDEIVRLTDAEIEAIRAEAEARATAAPPTRAPHKRRIRGEIGASIGTGEMRDIYGIAKVPLGPDGEAVVSGGASRGLARRPLRPGEPRR